jgi:hypothetical protein
MPSPISIQPKSGPLTRSLEQIWRYGPGRQVVIDKQLTTCAGTALRKRERSCTPCPYLLGLPLVLVPRISLSSLLCAPDVRLSILTDMIRR